MIIFVCKFIGFYASFIVYYVYTDYVGTLLFGLTKEYFTTVTTTIIYYLFQRVFMLLNTSSIKIVLIDVFFSETYYKLAYTKVVSASR